MTMPETTQSDLVEKLKSLDAAATPGPWRFDGDWHRIPSIVAGTFPVAHVEKSGFPQRADHTPKQAADAEIIPLLRNAVPEIIAMAEDAARLHDHCESMVRAIEHCLGGALSLPRFADEEMRAAVAAFRGENAS